MDLRFLGRTGYEAAVVAMQEFTRTRNASTRDELWICEHSPHFTQGLAGKTENVLNPGDIPVVATNRGDKSSRITNLRLDKTVLYSGLAGYVLGNSTRMWPLAARVNGARVTADTDQGGVDAAIER